ncbi:hypothetical protein J2X65_000607 [Ancylobacter sp. 3268]|uniref:hypothetical protein n=1 Tax=Ancylobacter sp. 3268 TaxID=2817752 RepID=UPI00285C5829|nr:hypothetical protein [Ancylobacter sp. 3268]MDR6951259.1 hypothetical protein [Ancylobacter sp. 3268]
MSGPTVELSIARLVVEGVAPSDAGALRRAVERELACRLAAQAAGADVPRPADHVDAGTMAVPLSAGPQRLGAAIAGQVIGGLKR